MPATIYTILKEYFVEIHAHGLKARIMSPIYDQKTFTFQTNLHYRSKSHPEGNKPASTFNSFATAERHLLQYIEEFQNTLDLGGDVIPGTNI
ncbi:hypothetical protein [Pedobacter nototheniae]|nr:hypothetical protein [Pedobacter nototheniae]